MFQKTLNFIKKYVFIIILIGGAILAGIIVISLKDKNLDIILPIIFSYLMCLLTASSAGSSYNESKTNIQKLTNMESRLGEMEKQTEIMNNHYNEMKNQTIQMKKDLEQMEKQTKLMEEQTKHIGSQTNSISKQTDIMVKDFELTLRPYFRIGQILPKDISFIDNIYDDGSDEIGEINFRYANEGKIPANFIIEMYFNNEKIRVETANKCSYPLRHHNAKGFIKNYKPFINIPIKIIIKYGPSKDEIHKYKYTLELNCIIGDNICEKIEVVDEYDEEIK